MFSFIAIFAADSNDIPSWVVPMGMAMDFIGCMTMILVCFHN